MTATAQHHWSFQRRLLKQHNCKQRTVTTQRWSIHSIRVRPGRCSSNHPPQIPTSKLLNGCFVGPIHSNLKQKTKHKHHKWTMDGSGKIKTSSKFHSLSNWSRGNSTTICFMPWFPLGDFILFFLNAAWVDPGQYAHQSAKRKWKDTLWPSYHVCSVNSAKLNKTCTGKHKATRGKKRPTKGKGQGKGGKDEMKKRVTRKRLWTGEGKVRGLLGNSFWPEESRK